MVFAFDSMPRLETERLMLRPVDPVADLPALFDLFADPAVAEHTDTGPFETLEDAREVMDWIGDIFSSRRGMRWAITVADHPESMVGTCGFNVWHRWNDTAEIGYDLARRLWGRGITTEAVRTMIDFGFSEMGLNRIEADVTVGNDASARVLEKLGFAEEGLLRQRGRWKGGYHDLRLFGLLREDWNAPPAG